MSQLIAYTSTSDGSISRYKDTVLESLLYPTGLFDNTGDNFLVGVRWQTTVGFNRGFLYFDTSSIPIGATVTGAILSIFLYSNNATAGYDFNIIIQSGQPTYPHDPMEYADYLFSHYSGDGGSIFTGDMAAQQYYDIKMNEDGRNMINCGGETKLCLRSNFDIDGVTVPTDIDSYVRLYTKEYGDAYRAKLTIDYAVYAPYVKIEITAEATASDADIAKVGGKRSLTIENHLIQNQTIANLVANTYLADYKDQKTKLRITRPTPPPFEVGDTIKVKI